MSLPWRVSRGARRDAKGSDAAPKKPRAVRDCPSACPLAARRSRCIRDGWRTTLGSSLRRENQIGRPQRSSVNWPRHWTITSVCALWSLEGIKAWARLKAVASRHEFPESNAPSSAGAWISRGVTAGASELLLPLLVQKMLPAGFKFLLNGLALSRSRAAATFPLHV